MEPVFPTSEANPLLTPVSCIHLNDCVGNEHVL